MSATFRYIFSLVLMLTVSVSLLAQNKTKKDTVRKDYRPTGIRFGTDVVSIVKSHRGNEFSGWEANADVDFYRYYLTADYGSWARQEELTNGNYKNNGTYFRLGVDINFLVKDPDHNMFFIGFRYGHSAFDETVNYNYTDPFYGPIDRSITTTGMKGHWGEVTTGLRVKIWGGFWMGYLARLKFAPGVKGAGAMQPYDMPGYGLVQNAPYWGFNYQLFWRIPIRKAHVSPGATP